MNHSIRSISIFLFISLLTACGGSSSPDPIADPLPTPVPVVQKSDVDGDTIPDEDDNCITVANTDQSDQDSDTVGDVCDAESNNDQVAGKVTRRVVIENNSDTTRLRF